MSIKRSHVNYKARFWMDPDGVFIDMSVAEQHSWWAARYLREKESKEVGFVEASNILQERGWIRGQVTDDNIIGMEGMEFAILKNGQKILDNYPFYEKIAILKTDTETHGEYIPKEKVNKEKWSVLVKRAMKTCRNI